jgi:phosphatidylserine/phosphatidylglycerophosphate/cardiolipin synthase-like enzyme
MREFFLIGVSTLLLLAPVGAEAKKGFIDRVIGAYEESHSSDVPAIGRIEVAFSPDEGSEQLVLRTIDSAKSEIRVLAYSFTSAPVVEALIRAKKRGVNVALVADKKSNAGEGSGGSGKSRAALSALVNAGCDVRVIDAYAIHHDKTIIVDRQTVQLGSYNYSAAAAHRNSENVLVNWNNPKLAEVYMGHFERNQRQAEAYRTQY